MIYGICNIQGVCHGCEGVKVQLGKAEGDHEADAANLGDVTRSRKS